MGRGILNPLPVEIIEEMLLKLPIKSLLRFKCVSKSWRSSISSKYFITEHLNKSKTGGTDFTHLNLIFTHKQTRPIGPLWDSIESCSIGSLLNDYEPHPSLGPNLSTFPIPALEDGNNWVFFFGSCNGLILVIIRCRGMYLWNPSTRKAKSIVYPQETYGAQCVWSGCSTHGFGYDESTDDYKVVYILSSLDPYRAEIYVYSWRTDSWKRIRNIVGNGFPIGYSVKFVNGRLHWLTSKDQGNATTSWYIVSLDLEEEKCQSMALPHCFSDYDYPVRPVVGDLGGYLSLICYNHLVVMDVWVMKEEVWSKIWTFSCAGYTGRCPKPLWLKKNGDIVVAFESDVVIYRGKDMLRQSTVDMFNARIEYVAHVESLVSPFGEEDEQLRQ